MVFYYHFCTTVTEISRECGEEVDDCQYDNGAFCVQRSTDPITEKCITNITTVNANYQSINFSIDCSDECRDAVEAFAEESGCCVSYFSEDGYYYDDGPTITDIFTECGVMIPDACTSYSPPRECLDCARDVGNESAGVSETRPFCLLVVIAITVGLITGEPK